MLARLRQIVLSLLVVAPAVLSLPAGRAGGQSPPPACPRESYVIGIAIFASGASPDLDGMFGIYY